MFIAKEIFSGQNQAQNPQEEEKYLQPNPYIKCK